jgi:hypothetical protein
MLALQRAEIARRRARRRELAAAAHAPEHPPEREAPVAPLETLDPLEPVGEIPAPEKAAPFRRLARGAVLAVTALALVAAGWLYIPWRAEPAAKPSPALKLDYKLHSEK